MATKCTAEAMKQIQALRTMYPWAVYKRVEGERLVVAVFNYRADAKEYAKKDPDNLTAVDASGCWWEQI